MRKQACDVSAEALDVTAIDGVPPIIQATPAFRPSPIPSAETNPATEGQILSSWQAARDIASHYALPFEEVRSEMNLMSQNLWNLLDSPQGWAVLGEQIALILQGTPKSAVLRPGIH